MLTNSPSSGKNGTHRTITVQDAASEILATKATLRVKDGDSLSMSIWVSVFDHTAWPLADDSTTGDDYGTIALVAPGLGQASHFSRCLVPLRIGALGCGKCWRHDTAHRRGARDGLCNECATAEHGEVGRAVVCEA